MIKYFIFSKNFMKNNFELRKIFMFILSLDCFYTRKSKRVVLLPKINDSYVGWTDTHAGDPVE